MQPEELNSGLYQELHQLVDITWFEPRIYRVQVQLSNHLNWPHCVMYDSHKTKTKAITVVNRKARKLTLPNHCQTREKPRPASKHEKSSRTKSLLFVLGLHLIGQMRANLVFKPIIRRSKARPRLFQATLCYCNCARGVVA